MLLILGDDRQDFRKLPNLTTKRIGIDAREFFAATPTLGRHARHDLLALFGWDQGPFVFVVSWLTTAFEFGFGLGRRRLVVRMR